ncbi:MAG: tetratricopeptide repeat protein [Nitrospinota bacterium]|nr:tetratricopeptide repeat protein [Nitrospinota bacterium]
MAPSYRVAALPLMVMILAGFGGPAHEGAALQGLEDYQGALEEYKKAQQTDPDNKKLDYNMGGAYHKLGEYQEAAKAFERAAGAGGALGEDAAFNRGVALYRAGEAAEKSGDMENAQKSYAAAAEGYKALLKSGAGGDDSRHNLELSLARIQEIENKKKQQSQQDKKEGQDGDSKDEEKSHDPREGEQSQKQDQSGQGKQDKNPEPEQMNEKDDRAREMTPEEAKMTLNAIGKDEQELKKELRKQASPPSRRPEKDW